ncbi:MAG: 6-pyruvoyl trahydropterin synthase family protein [Planctomycetota bacterium]
MTERFFVQLDKEQHVFSAAHFITFNRDVCERLHGHNYRVRVAVSSPLDENQYVVDFIALRDELSKILAELDHHMLLPLQHPSIRVTSDLLEVEVKFQERRWIFPRGDCVLLPIEQTTAELLAKYIGQQLLQALDKRCSYRPQAIRIEVDENHGQWGVWQT